MHLCCYIRILAYGCLYLPGVVSWKRIKIDTKCITVPINSVLFIYRRLVTINPLNDFGEAGKRAY